MRKATTKRAELQHRYLKTISSENLKLLKRRRNFLSRLYKSENRYFHKLDLNKLTDNKLFLENS